MSSSNLEFEFFTELKAEHYYFPHFIDDESMYDKVLAEVPFKQEMSGQWTQPRLTCLIGDPNRPYFYSGHIRIPVLMGQHVSNIRKKLNTLIEELIPEHPHFTSFLGNYYKNGLNNIMRHSDDENTLVKNTVIASLSLGATRYFDIYDKKTNLFVLRIPLTEGSLFIMGRDFQKKYTHQVPKQKKVKNGRINLTARVIVEQEEDA